MSIIHRSASVRRRMSGYGPMLMKRSMSMRCKSSLIVISLALSSGAATGFAQCSQGDPDGRLRTTLPS